MCTVVHFSVHNCAQLCAQLCTIRHVSVHNCAQQIVRKISALALVTANDRKVELEEVQKKKTVGGW